MHLSELSDNSTGPPLSLRARILILSSVLEIFLQKVCGNARSQNSHYLSTARARPAQPEFSEYSDYSEFSEFFHNWKHFPVFSRKVAASPHMAHMARSSGICDRPPAYGKFFLAYAKHIRTFNSRSDLAI